MNTRPLPDRVLAAGAGPGDGGRQLTDIAEKHDASPAQVSLAWLTGKDNVVAIPKATGEAYLADNLAARQLTLDPEDVEWIEELDRGERFVDRPEAPWK